MTFNPAAAAFQPGAGFLSPEVAAINDLMDRLSLACKEEAPRAAAAAAPKPVASASAAAPKPAAPSGGIKIMRAGAPAAPAAAAPAAASGWGAGGASSSASRGGVSRDNAAREIGEYVKARGVRVLKTSGLRDRLALMADDQNNHVAREAALLAYAALCDSVGAAVEPFVAPMLPVFLERLSDKIAVRAAADQACQALARLLHPCAVPRVMPAILSGASPAKKWQCKEGAFKIISTLCETAPDAVQAALPDIVPVVSDGIVDARDEVKEAAVAAAESAFALAGNRDIAPCVPSFLSCIRNPKETAEAIIKLSGTTFVQAVEAPALAVMCPLLIKGLKEETAIKRKAANIIANMSKLVLVPADADTFLPKLLPRLEAAANETPDPECRSVCAAAVTTVRRVAEAAHSARLAEDDERKVLKEAEVEAMLVAILAANGADVAGDALLATAVSYCAAIATSMVNKKQTDPAKWQDEIIEPFLLSFLDDGDAAAAKVAEAWAQQAEAASHVVVDDGLSDDDEDVLCNCEFSLAYGGKILLNNARLRLKRGRRYGLCGHNGVGKTTLMRAINNEKVEGFPPKDQVCSVYLESDIDPAMAEYPIVEFVFKDPTLQITAKPPSMEEVVEMLRNVGFDDERQKVQVGSLSGGWKMKLALARAMLMHPDILLLDEPTNHLDVVNVAWLEDYLTRVIPRVTCLIVSHDSSFLDNVCTDIAHYESRKLKYYHGNLSEFVKVKPEAKSYYTLAAATLRFNFPKPSFLDGVTSGEKPVLAMKKVTFTYPGASKPQLEQITCSCRMSSRVAILGPNGAGKSTLIKLMTGELKPDTGIVNKHINVRVAYVSQHALHHLEDHLDKTPNQYIRLRYGKGEDKEEAEKVTRVLTAEEEEAIKKQIWVIDGQNRVLEKLLGRRKKKKSFEYEVKWVGLSSIEFNRWIMREVLVERGFEKLCREMDDKINAEKGEAAARPLTLASVEQYLQDFGLEPEFGTHSAIRGLSGGQKVKLVLAAAMWHCPHLLVLDEPTNYLDRDSLGALAQAIKEFGGGVVMISHHSEFVGALANEVWDLKDGKLSCHAKEEGKEEEAAH
ncbi:hypothetical protein HYH02_007524 [Chlamydomonas schloesseri]|uniref:Elongation factor EF-3 n=1 Tax=Chlamydomonas schloesseri TaxID=2026947 RepID=A0A835WHU4_9CHLO|nr:hypothetical protein HYH02_007524 [Chlamydomonas schloesseri]|eukprot:KAG2447603.1 hypothetical protein HYH02_007524 [Chlamydomonas schloesseri]